MTQDTNMSSTTMRASRTGPRRVTTVTSTSNTSASKLAEECAIFKGFSTHLHMSDTLGIKNHRNHCVDEIVCNINSITDTESTESAFESCSSMEKKDDITSRVRHINVDNKVERSAKRNATAAIQNTFDSFNMSFKHVFSSFAAEPSNMRRYFDVPRQWKRRYATVFDETSKICSTNKSLKAVKSQRTQRRRSNKIYSNNAVKTSISDNINSAAFCMPKYPLTNQLSYDKKNIDFILPDFIMQLFKPKKPKFKLVRKNRYRVPQCSISNEAELCSCDPQQQQFCHDETCFNRSLFISCSKDCPAKTHCKNQEIPNNDHASFEPFTSGVAGWGLRASDTIPEKRYVVEYVGEVINQEMLNERFEQYIADGVRDFYFLTLSPGYIIDAYKFASEARFINHSCDPNCRIEKWHVHGECRIGIFASRVIEKGEEITIDYGYDQLRCERKQPCFCGTALCRGYIGSSKESQTKQLEKSEDRKNRRKNTKSLSGRSNSCFCCTEKLENNEIIYCDYQKNGVACDAVFHRECIIGDPIGDWYCPRHLCESCKRGTAIYCPCCVSAWCRQHFPARLPGKSAYPILFLCDDCEKDNISMWHPWQNAFDKIPTRDFVLSNEIIATQQKST